MKKLADIIGVVMLLFVGFYPYAFRLYTLFRRPRYLYTVSFCIAVFMGIATRIALAKNHSASFFQCGVMLGFTLNALAMLANGGQMPVISRRKVGDNSIWKQADEGTRFVWLVDRFGSFSIGDFIILGSLALSFTSLGKH